jgi:hypothetical protein
VTGQVACQQSSRTALGGARWAPIVAAGAAARLTRSLSSPRRRTLDGARVVFGEGLDAAAALVVPPVRGR